jgi:hypothetical protein
MYDSSLSDPTNISLSTNQTKRPDRLNRGAPTGLFLSLRSCRSGAGSKKRPERGGGGRFFTLKSLGVRLKKTVLDGRPCKAEIITQICNKFYDNTPTGMIGNDDCGQMSAWYIFSTLGFYPVNPISGEYVLGIPQVKKAIVKLANQKELSIASRHVDKNMSIEFDDKIILSPAIKFDWLKRGGSLVFKSNHN